MTARLHDYGPTEYIDGGGSLTVTCRACGVVATSPGPAVDPDCPGPTEAERSAYRHQLNREGPAIDPAAWRAELAKIDPDMHRRLVNGNWITEQCKHCGRPIVGAGGDRGWVHADGPQRLMHRCAINPYGYDACPVGEPCSFACRGAGDDETYYQDSAL